VRRVDGDEDPLDAREFLTLSQAPREAREVEDGK
jgi:hypothetical protein